MEPHRDAEAIAQRRRQQPLPRGRADQREAWQIDADRARRGAFADPQIERAILHRGVEHFLDRGLEAVNLVDAEDVAILQIGKERGEIARFGDAIGGAACRARGCEYVWVSWVAG